MAASPGPAWEGSTLLCALGFTCVRILLALFFPSAFSSKLIFNRKKCKIIKSLQAKPCFFALCLDISGYGNVSIHLRFIRCAHFSKTDVILNIWHWVFAREVFYCMQALVQHRWTKPWQTWDWFCHPLGLVNDRHLKLIPNLLKLMD